MAGTEFITSAVAGQDASRPSPSMAVEAGGGREGEVEEAPVVPDHRLIRKIGQGAFGDVWLSRSITDMYRAVKVVHRARFASRFPYDREFSGLQHFEKVCLSHAGLVVLLHVGRAPSDQYFYYVMEIADDIQSGQEVHPGRYQPKTLEKVLKDRQRLGVEEAYDLGLRLCSSMAILQSFNLIHRDIKPANIIYVKSLPKLADIGLVQRIGQRDFGAGTPPYAPPEGPGGPTTDVYGLGRVLYKALTGQLQERFPELPAELLGLPERTRIMQLNEVIMKACAFEPSQRYSSAEAMAADMTRAKGDPDYRPRSAARKVAGAELAGAVPRPKRIALLGKANVQPDGALVEFLQTELAGRDFQVFVDRSMGIKADWVPRVQQEILDCDVVVVLASPRSVQSEMVAFQAELAEERRQGQDAKPQILAVEIGRVDPMPEPFGRLIRTFGGFRWHAPQRNAALLEELLEAMRSGRMPTAPMVPALEVTGGAVGLDSHYYIERPTDREFIEAIERHDSIVLVKGARQIGKTSLLARGLHAAREAGAHVVLADFQKLDAGHLSSIEALFLKLGDFLADQLELDVLPSDVWDARRGPNANFERYLRREVFPKLEGHLVWGMDEVDRLFGCPFGSAFFGLIRAWHNERALDPTCPWSRMTLAIAYATEACLFISDLNQSPFNVGTRLRLEDFTLEQVGDLNRRYGSPLSRPGQVEELFGLVGGQPFLVRTALNHLSQPGADFDAFVAQADQEEGIFGDHLRRILMLLNKDRALREVARVILDGGSLHDADQFYRLHSAGLMKGQSPESAAPRCRIYETYLRRRLGSRAD